SDCRQLEFIALDMETTGLDPRRDVILSIGLVAIRQQAIVLDSAQHHLICPDRNIPEQSAVIHQITDDQAAAGEHLETVLTRILPQLAGKVMIAHNAELELQFLGCACLQLYDAGFQIPVVDTQRIARRTLERRNQVYKPEQLRLAECRQQYHLPHYQLHNALSDALAAAELFLVQLAQYDERKPIPLKYFLS
ncbi:MAG: exonuclease domain-containing protein, partial [Gammaproteobacteria bacterium]